jgi:hypothetical protein
MRLIRKTHSYGPQQTAGKRKPTIAFAVTRLRPSLSSPLHVFDVPVALISTPLGSSCQARKLFFFEAGRTN